MKKKLFSKTCRGTNPNTQNEVNPETFTNPETFADDSILTANRKLQRQTRTQSSSVRIKICQRTPASGTCWLIKSLTFAQPPPSGLTLLGA